MDFMSVSFMLISSPSSVFASEFISLHKESFCHIASFSSILPSLLSSNFFNASKPLAALVSPNISLPSSIIPLPFLS